MTDDIELYRRWRDGDEQAAQDLVERHYDGIVRFFRTKVGPEADDLVQRTFLAASEGSFREASSFRTFLFGCARNVLLEFFRGRRRDAKVEPDFSEESVHDISPGVSTMAAGRAEERLLVEALQRLPVDIQMTLELFYWEDLSVGELAEILAIPPGTVKSRLHRGRGLLRDAMASLPKSEDEERSVRLLIGEWVGKIRDHIGAPPPPE